METSDKVILLFLALISGLILFTGMLYLLRIWELTH